ncbi:MAG: hypothetical protein KDM63_12575 [Verrucomicrobiae bacterium]|nr:hypothetical protein [Verrucomicrobiae bacterium]
MSRPENMCRIVSAFLAIVLSAGCAKDNSPKAYLVFDLSGEEFRDFPAEGTLEAIGAITVIADGPVRVGFTTDHQNRDFLCSTGQVFFRRGCSISPPGLQLSYDRITFDGEAVSLEEAGLRIRTYVEAAGQIKSVPVFALSASLGAKNSKLAGVLDLLHEAGITHLIIETKEPVVVNKPDPEPRRVGTAHEIDPDSLFRPDDLLHKGVR